MSDTQDSGRMAEPWGQVIDPNQPAAMQQPPTPAGDQSQEQDATAPRKVKAKKAKEVIKEARARATRCMEFESEMRSKARFDWKFVEGDSDNGNQWPDKIRSNREKNEQPCLTINKTRQHCLQIINDAKQNTPAIKFRPVSDGATVAAAEVWEGLARHIEYQSNAKTAYDTATEYQVKIGFSYWLVTTDYEAPDSFDQEIYIRRIKDPFSVYLDPDIEESDGSDAKFGFIITQELMVDFLAEYPQFKATGGGSTLGLDEGWVDKDHLKIIQYYRVVEVPDTLLSFVVPETGERQTVFASDLGPELSAQLKADPQTRRRASNKRKIEWFKIAGDQVLHERMWAGVYVPIVRVIGEETIIDGKLDRKGHVRAMKDPQRMYNYWTTSAVENVALQSKTPYVGAAAAFEGHEDQWKVANRENQAFLPYNHVDEDGNKLDPPQRQQPVTLPDAYVTGMGIASNEIMMVTGQYQSQMGQQGNEVSGKAIGERQRQGDNATYHYIDNLAIAITYTGKILLDLIPKIYDTGRIRRILTESGDVEGVQIDPNMKGPYQSNVPPEEQANQARKQSKTETGIAHVLNPKMGKYEVYADTGPAYSTRRQEAFQAYTQILTQAPAFASIIGDILLRAGDFPMSDEAADRLRRMVPLQALGDAPPPEVVQLQQQVQGLTESLTAAIQALGDKASEIKAKQEEIQIDVFKAETQRIQGMLELLSPEALEAVIGQTVQNVLANNGLADVDRTSGAFLVSPEVPPGADQLLGQQGPSLTDPLNAELGQVSGDQSLAEPLGPTSGGGGTLTQGGQSPDQAIEGMRRAKDGNLYLPDPQNPGKYLQVME